MTTSNYSPLKKQILEEPNSKFVLNQRIPIFSKIVPLKSTLCQTQKSHRHFVLIYLYCTLTIVQFLSVNYIYLFAFGCANVSSQSWVFLKPFFTTYYRHQQSIRSFLSPNQNVSEPMMSIYSSMSWVSSPSIISFFAQSEVVVTCNIFIRIVRIHHITWWIPSHDPGHRAQLGPVLARAVVLTINLTHRVNLNMLSTRYFSIFSKFTPNSIFCNRITRWQFHVKMLGLILTNAI